MFDPLACGYGEEFRLEGFDGRRLNEDHSLIERVDNP
jgi:hypothetical protein